MSKFAKDKSYTFSDLVVADQARIAAAKLWQYCIQTGCLYCAFFDDVNETCDLEHRPRNYPVAKLVNGGNDNAERVDGSRESIG